MKEMRQLIVMGGDALLKRTKGNSMDRREEGTATGERKEFRTEREKK